MEDISALVAICDMPADGVLVELGMDAKDVSDGIPGLLLIGDVAYQHKPGASSHFDVPLKQCCV